MNKSYLAPSLSVALTKLKEIVAQNESLGKNTVIFCEDRLSLAAERTVCAAVGGTFLTGVYTFARFLSSEKKLTQKVLSSQGSAMVIRKIIEDNARQFKLFKKLFSASGAQAVYDTIAVLYSSRVSPQDISQITTENTLFKSKLNDLAFIYSEYNKYLTENGLLDRNTYLKLLPDVIENSSKIKGSSVILLGFQSFTSSTSECARACMRAANSVDGIFIGGAEDIYTNESVAAFHSVAKEFGGAENENLQSTLCLEAEVIRKTLFNPERFICENKIKTDKVHIFEAADEVEELEFIAASIKKHVLSEGERYAKISVMLPDVKSSQSTLERVFGQFKVPYYIDRRIPLSEHFICDFIINLLNCLHDGCSFESVNAVISSPLFPVSRKDKDIYRNYLLRFGNFRGAAKREPKEEVCKNGGFNYASVHGVYEVFNGTYKMLLKGSGADITVGIKRALASFGVEKKLEDLHEKYKDVYPVKAQLAARAYSSAIAVLDEAAALTQNIKLSVKEYIKILKSGFTACEISLIPPKADAVFVGDMVATANTGSNVVFAAGLTEAVPKTGSDTALLTDREIAELERLCVNVSPKIQQVNLRSREVTALNVCAFRKHLYLTYPVYSNGGETAKSEIISYVKNAFLNVRGNPLTQITQKQLNASLKALPYYCSEEIPAIKQLVNVSARPEVVSAIYSALEINGKQAIADEALIEDKPRELILNGKKLFGGEYGSVSPTTLESYFACPYQNFMSRGLSLLEREEGSMRAVDAGNFIHNVLEDVFHPDKINGGGGEFSKEQLKEVATKVANELLLTPKYAPLTDSKSGKYTGGELVLEAVEVCLGAFEQLENSNFKVAYSETSCNVPLNGGLKLYGRIDRVDECGDMVRVVDYKTGTITSSADSYYMGLKLQLPLYLTSASKGKRPIGAYYFPATVGYVDDGKNDGVFRLKGFMDCSEEVVHNSDITLQPKKKSKYFDAYLPGGRKVESSMPKEDFEYFIQYATLIARKGADEMVGGNVTPSPATGACEYCKMGGSCNFLVGVDGESRNVGSIKCEQIANIVKKIKGDK
ncbi:MAG: PD-(D/E)XK nuclease family protein [Clostridia bacterium]|nr:PD-(D/E)XK nuclease family protein [Clostridia bacterium]